MASEKWEVRTDLANIKSKFTIFTYSVDPIQLSETETVFNEKNVGITHQNGGFVGSAKKEK